MKRNYGSKTPPGITACTLVLTLLSLSVGLAQSDYRDSADHKAGQSTSTAVLVNSCMRAHDAGNLVFGISNFGRIGTGTKPFHDCIVGGRVPEAEFPKGSNTTYLYKGALWVGAVVGRDTLVSCGAEFNTPAREMHSEYPIFERSTLEPESPAYKDAVSEQDFIAVYQDTFTRGAPYPSFDFIAHRPHRPLGIEVFQYSYQWSHRYSEDFAIIEFLIRNTSHNDLEDVYLGIYMDADVHPGGQNPALPPGEDLTKGITDGRDDLTGFLYDYPAMYGNCEFMDTVGVAWTVDNEGDFDWDNGFAVPNVAGIRILGEKFKLENMSYNWWVWNYNNSLDYGPQKRENFRNMGNGKGTPIGDVNKYAVMSNHEIDFDQPYTAAVNSGNPVWVGMSDEEQAWYMSIGGDNQYVLSVGPFKLHPGDEIILPIAYVAGRDFHYDIDNFMYHLIWNYRPDRFIRWAGFSDLAHNAMVASWIYDNPGIDTDDDGYRGKFHVCALDSAIIEGEWTVTFAETTFYEGDGVPDLIGASPPPAPHIWVEPIFSGLRVRFNGYESETTKDVLSGVVDFEGYRIYLGRDERESSLSRIESYDRENYDKMVYNASRRPVPQFELRDPPFTLEELRCLYGSEPDPCNDTTFHPFDYTAAKPYVHPLYPDSIFFFTGHDYNNSTFSQATGIRKVYPHEPRPSSGLAIMPDQLTDEGYPKYYEYEFMIENLLPTVPYHVNVTAFDFGSPAAGLAPLESSKTTGVIRCYAAGSEDEANGNNREVYIYPNPYRIDDEYRDHGFEGRMLEDLPHDKVRSIHFANLPARCVIRIFSLDGDLVREIKHRYDPADPASSHDTWNLVSRNRQLVVSGLYYWSVEDEEGRTQMGKLVILF